MGMAAILFNGTKVFEQTVNILSTEGHMWDLVKIVQAFSEKKTFKNFMISCLYNAQRKRADNPHPHPPNFNLR